MAYTIEEIASEANIYHHLPGENLPMPDRILWWTLRSIYEDFRRGSLSKNEAVEMKKTAVIQYKKDSGQLQRYHDLMREQAEYWKSIELSARAYALSNERTAAGDQFYKTVYGCELKERRNDDDT